MTISTTTHRHFPGSTVAAAVGCAVVIGGVAALGLAVSQHDSVQPAAPTSVCVTTSCVGPGHPVLPGRHDFRLRPGRDLSQPGGGFKPTGDGGRIRAGRP